MKKIKRTWSVEEKLAILKDIDSLGVVEGCRKHGIYTMTYYDWKQKLESNGESGLVPYFKKQETKELKKLQEENDLLKKLLAEKEMELAMKDELLKKKIQQWKSEKKS